MFAISAEVILSLTGIQSSFMNLSDWELLIVYKYFHTYPSLSVVGVDVVPVGG